MALGMHLGRGIGVHTSVHARSLASMLASCFLAVGRWPGSHMASAANLVVALELLLVVSMDWSDIVCVYGPFGGIQNTHYFFCPSPLVSAFLISPHYLWIVALGSDG